jgi:hypothetical protein
MNMKFYDTSSEKITCPHCKGTIEVSIELSSSANIDFEPVSYGYNDFREGIREYTRDDFSPYTKRLPNIGALGQFLPAKSDTMEFLTNGHIAFLKQSMAGLEIDIDEKANVIDVQRIVDRFSCDLPQVVPVTQTRSFVRMMGNGVEMTCPCRTVHLAYSLFPDAVFYQWGTQESSEKPPMLCVVSGGEPVGFIMGMKLSDENLWNKAEGK